jgi:Chloroplast envelope transporter
MNNVYVVKELKTPNFFQRLFSLKPKINALIEINNLLATKPLEEISVEAIEFIAATYNVNLHRKFSSQLKEIYQQYLARCLSDNLLSDSELSELNTLKHLLVLTDSEVAELQLNLTSEIFRKSFDQAISGGTFEKSTEEFIDKLQKNIRLSDDIAAKIGSESSKHFMDNELQKIVADQKISPDEWNELNQIAKNLNVTLSIDDATQQQLEKFKLYWLIENGTLPTKDIEITLPRNEHCYFSMDADWLETRTITKRINYGGPALRIKIMKGVYYRAGSVGVQRVTSEELTLIDSGIIYITNKRIIFVGSNKSANIQLSKILSVSPYSDGVGIEKDSGKSPVIRVSNNADIMALILGRVINDLQ